MILQPQEHSAWSDTLLVINLGGGHVCYLEHRYLTSYNAQDSTHEKEVPGPQMSTALRLRNPDLDTGYV